MNPAVPDRINRSASEPARIAPFRGYSPKSRAGFSAVTRANQDGGSPRSTTPSWQVIATSVSSDGEPKGTDTPSGWMKTFSHPCSLPAGSPVEWSLPTVEIRPSLRPPQRASGLAPSEHSSGARQRRGPITKTGNAHVRRLLARAPGTTATRRGSARRCASAGRASRDGRWRSPMGRRRGCIAVSGTGAPPASRRWWPMSPWRANSRAASGRCCHSGRAARRGPTGRSSTHGQRERRCAAPGQGEDGWAMAGSGGCAPQLCGSGARGRQSAMLESDPSRRSTVMRPGLGQPARIRVARRRSSVPARPSPPASSRAAETAARSEWCCFTAGHSIPAVTCTDVGNTRRGRMK